MKRFFIICAAVLISTAAIVFVSNICLNNDIGETKDGNSKYNCSGLGDLLGDDVIRINFKNYTIDYHSKDFSENQIKGLTDKCINDGVNSQHQMDCCMTMSMYP